MLLMVEKGIRGEICHCIYWHAEAKNKYINDYDKNNIQYWDMNNSYVWATSQNLPANNFIR